MHLNLNTQNNTIDQKAATSQTEGNIDYGDLDYGDVIYDRAFNKSFQNKLVSLQYNAALAITGAIRGSSREKLYQELGLESLKSRRWYRKLCLFFKLKKNKHPSYLFDMIPKVLSTRTTRNHNNIPLFNVKQEYF